MALKITPGNTDDRAALKEIVRTLSGKNREINCLIL